jgi:hypothetical protein
MQGGQKPNQCWVVLDFVNNRRFQVLLKTPESKRATCSGYFKPLNQTRRVAVERTGGSWGNCLILFFFENLRTFDYISNPGILIFFTTARGYETLRTIVVPGRGGLPPPTFIHSLVTMGRGTNLDEGTIFKVSV